MIKRIVSCIIVSFLLITALVIHFFSKPKNHVSKGSCLPVLSKAISDLRKYVNVGNKMPSEAEIWSVVGLSKEFSNILSYSNINNFDDKHQSNLAVFKCNIPVPMNNNRKGYYYALMSGEVVVVGEEIEYLGENIPTGKILKKLKIINK